MTPPTKSDLDIKREVQRGLGRDPRVDPAGISVRVTHGVVSLTGSVAAYVEKIVACETAHRVVGVLDLVDELEVNVLGQVETDEGIARAVRHALVWNVYVPDEDITSTVSNAWVTLEGAVRHRHERQEAMQAVQRLSCVRGVSNRIAIELGARTLRTRLQDEGGTASVG